MSGLPANLVGAQAVGVQALGLLAPPSLVVAAASATALRMSRSGPVAVVVVKAGAGERAPLPMPPPTPAAVRLAAELRGRGHPATATWRLVRSDVQTVAEAGLVLELLDGGSRLPTVVAAGVARTDEVDRLMGRCRPLVLAADDDIGRVVIEAAPGGALPLQLPPAGAAVVVAHAGIAAPPAWVESIDRVLGSND